MTMVLRPYIGIHKIFLHENNPDAQTAAALAKQTSELRRAYKHKQNQTWAPARAINKCCASKRL